MNWIQIYLLLPSSWLGMVRMQKNLEFPLDNGIRPKDTRPKLFENKERNIFMVRKLFTTIRGSTISTSKKTLTLTTFNNSSPYGNRSFMWPFLEMSPMAFDGNSQAMGYIPQSQPTWCNLKEWSTLPKMHGFQSLGLRRNGNSPLGLWCKIGYGQRLDLSAKDRKIVAIVPFAIKCKSWRVTSSTNAASLLEFGRKS
jgi:hypothetical protein